MEAQNWFGLKGDETLALDWPLNEDSHVIEIGGFEGRWAWQIWEKFNCWITIFEPQLWAVERMEHRFHGLHKIKIHPYGLWVEAGTFSLGGFGTDGTSLLSHREPIELGNFENFETVFMEIQKADVVLMNIEGSEYILIPEMIETGIMSRFEHFWCQFHPHDSSDLRHEEIFAEMEKTHEMIWNCFPTAVAWRKR